MIERENLKFLKNVIDLQNKDVNYRTLDDIVYAIKEDDHFGFLHNIVGATNSKVDFRLLENVLQTAKKEPDIEPSLLDSFSTPQVNAKFNIINHAEKLGLINKETSIVILGCWFGSILIPALAPKVKKIMAIDMDERVINVAKNRLFMEYENVEFIADDIFENFRKEYQNADLFINTSCEHMKPMSEWGPSPKYVNPWWTRMKKGAHFAFQSNDMFNIPTHINCVNNPDEFRTQLPENFEVQIEDEVNDERGTRFTLIGKIL
tara:strand:- start:270 stop:1055 length:786 start_codon:yes stop_codon:yes gene_type:complete